MKLWIKTSRCDVLLFHTQTSITVWSSNLIYQQKQKSFTKYVKNNHLDYDKKLNFTNWNLKEKCILEIKANDLTYIGYIII